MISYKSSVISRAVMAALAALMSCSLCLAEDKDATVPETVISELKAGLREAAAGDSSVEVRRACKGVIRRAAGLLEATPDAVNKYAVLELMFEGQKRLLTLEATDSNRAALYETCAMLKDAPDEYAETRFDADMILSEKELAEADAKVAERIEALEKMLARYRGTAAEWKSLVIGSLIATRLLDFDLEQEISDTMAERFGGDHAVIEFRRKKNMGGEIDSVFSGTYQASDGSSLTFPYDRMGHQYVLYFWSQAFPGADDHIGALRDLQKQHPGRFEVYSFNVDELPDAGEKELRRLKADWTAFHLPGGRKNSAYRAYAETDPKAVFINGQGHALLVSPPKNVGGHGGLDAIRQGVLGGWNLPGIADSLDSGRYLAQLRYLFIGDFLVAEKHVSSLIPVETLNALQACFTAPPVRYRLSHADSLANYRRAEKLCSEAIRKHVNDPDLWVIRNRRIIALIGMGSLASEPRYLLDAAKEAETVLDMKLPPGADVAARFCLAKAALRAGGDPEAVLEGLVAKAGGTDAPPAALAAAAVIALEANARTAHNRYRKSLLEIKGDDVEPALWPVCSFLRDKHHCYRNFWASPGGYGFGRPQKYKLRDTVAGLDKPEDRERRGDFEMTKLDGGKVELPAAGAGNMLGVLFVEPPSDSASYSNLINTVNAFGSAFTNSGVDVAVVFLSDDTNKVSSLANGLRPGFQVGTLPGGIENPVVQQLGVLSADRIPNPVLYRPDGTLAWTISGLDYRAFGQGMSYAVGIAIGSNIRKVRSDVAFETLARGDYQSALKQFSEYMPQDGTGRKRRKGDWWTSDRHQGMAFAYMGIGDWNKALVSIDAALEQRKDDFKSAICKCHGLVEMYLTKAAILEKLDRPREAMEARSSAANESLPHSKLPPGLARQGVPIGVYYEQLKRIRLSVEGQGQGSVQ